MKRHPLDPWSLIAGLFLSGLGIAFLIPAEPISFANGLTELVGWIVPVVVVLVGIAMIAPAIRRRDGESELAPPPEPYEPI